MGTSCGTNCYTYTSGTSVTLTATAASGYNFSGWNGSGISCSGTGPCTVSMTAGRSVSATFAMPGATTGAPAILFSDLDSGPSTGGQDNQGVFVTIWGKNFGATPGSITVGGGQVASIVSWTQGSGSYAAWSMDKVVFQLGSQAATGNIVLTNTNGTSNGIPFTVRAGNIYFVTPNGTGNGNYATPMSPSAAYTVMGPGKTFYFRGGTYNQGYSPVGGYTDRNYALDQAHGGSAGLPMAMVGYPNETAVFEALNASRNNFAFGTGGAPASYVTLANFTLHGGSTCIEDGGFWTNAKSGGVGSRIIGNVLSASYGGANTMAGLIMIQNDYWRVLGNEIKDTGTGAPINNNHAIYNQSGASETEIAWNYFHNLRMGHVIQVHTDNYYTYSNVRIHDNVIAKGTNGDSRAINVGTANGDSYGSIYNNIMDGVGSNFSAIAIWSGSWKIFNNTMYNIYTPGSSMVFVTNSAYVNFAAPASWLPAPVVELENNIFYSDGSSPYISLSTSNPAPIVTVNHNLYFNYGAAPSQDTAPRTGNPLFANAAAGDFRLQNSSPAVNTGIATTVVTIDHDGVGRPQGGVVDVGAYEQ